MICRKCGHNIGKEKFCTKCGNQAKIKMSEIVLNIIYTLVPLLLLILYFKHMIGFFNIFIPLFCIFIYIIIFLSIVALKNSYSEKLTSLSVLINLLIAAVLSIIFYLCTGIFLIRGFICYFHLATVLFSFIVVFTAFMKKYEIKYFIEINYNYLKDKFGK